MHKFNNGTFLRIFAVNNKKGNTVYNKAPPLFLCVLRILSRSRRFAPTLSRVARLVILYNH